MLKTEKENIAIHLIYNKENGSDCSVLLPVNLSSSWRQDHTRTWNSDLTIVRLKTKKSTPQKHLSTKLAIHSVPGLCWRFSWLTVFSGMLMLSWELLLLLGPCLHRMSVSDGWAYRAEIQLKPQQRCKLFTQLEGAIETLRAEFISSTQRG